VKSLRRLTYPYLVWIAIFTLAPLLLVAFYAFTAYDASGKLFFTLQGFNKVFSTADTVALNIFALKSLFGIDWQVPIYVNVFAKSLEIALFSTIICLLVGYPAAWLLARNSQDVKHRGNGNLLLFLFVMPMWMNALLRTYAWLALLEPRGIINSLLGLLNIGPVQFLYNDFGIGLGMVYNYLPFMVLPIQSVWSKSAQRDRSGRRPRSQPAPDLSACHPAAQHAGVLSGINMVFMPAMTTFLIPDLLGGGRYLLIGNTIERQFMISRDMTTGSALSILLLVFVLASMRILTRMRKRMTREGC
jgi:spermidine/putrescine transport system permease protein